jgi:hypothetical protein
MQSDTNMITPNSKHTDTMNTEINERLMSAFHYLISDVLQRPDVATITNSAPPAHSLQYLMREAATQNNVAEIQSLYNTHGHVIYETSPLPMCEILALGDNMHPSHTALYAAAFQDDIGLTTQLETPDAALVSNFNALFAQIKPSFQNHLPLWWAELESIVKTIVLATAQNNRFGGASAFSAWGSILVNPANCKSPLGTALTLVHESSHLKLFYAYLDDEIVLNDPSESYASPLRREARPMNGIYHAAFVLARMALFLDDVQKVDTAKTAFANDAQEIKDELARTIAAFDAAYEVIASEGVLTPLGQEVIIDAATVVAQCHQR